MSEELVSLTAPCTHVIAFEDGAFEHGDVIECKECGDSYIYNQELGIAQLEDDFNDYENPEDEDEDEEEG